MEEIFFYIRGPLQTNLPYIFPNQSLWAGLHKMYGYRNSVGWFSQQSSRENHPTEFLSPNILWSAAYSAMSIDRVLFFLRKWASPTRRRSATGILHLVLTQPQIVSVQISETWISNTFENTLIASNFTPYHTLYTLHRVPLRILTTVQCVQLKPHHPQCIIFHKNCFVFAFKLLNNTWICTIEAIFICKHCKV